MQGTVAQQVEFAVKNSAFALGKSVGVNAIIDRLIFAQPLTNNSTQLIFPILKDDQTGTTGISLEKRLNRQDVFMASRWGFFLAKAASVGAVKDAPLFTYDNATGLDTATATGVKALYNRGMVNYQVDNTETLGEYPLSKFYRVPELQKSDVLSAYGFVNAASADDEVSNAISLDGQDYDTNMKSIFPLSEFNFNGNVDNKLSINLPSGLTLAPGSGAIYAILVFDGYTVKGAAR